MNARLDVLFQDLIKNPDFIAWVLEERSELDAYWKSWSSDDAVKNEALEQARFSLLSIQHQTLPITDEHIAYKVNQALEIARRRENANKTLTKSDSWFAFGRAIAASVLILIAVGICIYIKFQNQNLFIENQQQLSIGKPAETIIEVVNLNNKVKYIQLPDGSSVVLRKNSRISYNKQFDADRRVVILSGEAFFEVVKDPERPFFVYANELVTKVLGTSFSIKADESDKNVLVAVKTGKVSVFTKTDQRAKEYESNKGLSALLLTCNQQAAFERDISRLARSTISGAALLKIPIENQKFTYNATPVAEVFASLERAYGIEIDYNEKIMSHCSITATLGDEPLDNKLKWICAILEANYQVNENKISITGNSCQ
ncbi:FecR family protein [Dyadobacter sp. CY356]|uniref:FecR family protein n=1 Tax=Dyadobacter sp. CY356 TaxID=2906442 RepID=UPI001F1B8198|nr:FecR family protein [Dyadobacter sp. CY356]MCF0054190.1 FecR family protein [Dyadobacter sp. CY356]